MQSAGLKLPIDETKSKPETNSDMQALPLDAVVTNLEAAEQSLELFLASVGDWPAVDSRAE